MAETEEPRLAFQNYYWRLKALLQDYYVKGDYIDALRLLIYAIGDMPESVQLELQDDVNRAFDLLKAVREKTPNTLGYVGLTLVFDRELARASAKLVQELNRKLTLALDRRGYLEFLRESKR